MSITSSKTKLNKTKTTTTKTKKFNKKLTLKDTIMDSDDEYDASTVVSPKMFDFISKPEKMKPCGEVFITMVLRLEEIYDTDRNELCKALVNYNFEDYQKFLKSQKRIANKRNKAKENKFVPTDENGIKLRKTNVRGEFMKMICELKTKKDEKNKDYFKNGKFNSMTYINVEWMKFKEKGDKYVKKNAKGENIKNIYKKINEKVDKINGLFNQAYDKQKPPKKPNTRWTGYFIFGSEFREKNQDKPKYKEFRGIKFIKIISEKWKKLSDEQKEVYNSKANALNAENKKKLIEWEKEMEKRKMELVKKQETENKIGVVASESAEVSNSSDERSGDDTTPADEGEVSSGEVGDNASYDTANDSGDDTADDTADDTDNDASNNDANNDSDSDSDSD